MKLAELLVRRADLQKKIASLRERIKLNVIFQEGSKPSEDAKALIAQASLALTDLRSAVTKINETNIGQKMPDGRSIMEWIAEREGLAQLHALLKEAIEGTNLHRSRYGRQEIIWHTAIDVPALQEQLDSTAQKIRKVNLALQEHNWKVEI